MSDRWQIIETEILSGKIIKYSILQNGEEISFEKFLSLLSGDSTFRKYYNSILSQCPFNALFWENPPVTKSNIAESYEFVLIDSPYLSKVSPDLRTFSDYFTQNEKVVDFPNLGGDAHLIAPCPIGPPQNYTQIGNFVRNAPESQIDAFWQRVGQIFGLIICRDNKWLSTSGLGVYWLHARIDSYPKYYQYGPYRLMV